jgi:predicted nucleic acid-binding protein
VTSGEPVVAPNLLPFEVTNIIRKRVIRDAMSLGDADLAVEQFQALAITMITPPEVHQEALRLTDAFGFRAAYDAHYVVLARLLGCELWTDDAELIQVVGSQFTYVRAISSFQVPAVAENGTA